MLFVFGVRYLLPVVNDCRMVIDGGRCSLLVLFVVCCCVLLFAV